MTVSSKLILIQSPAPILSCFLSSLMKINCSDLSDSVPLVNDPGRISLEEFIEGAEKDPWVMEQLKLDIGPCGWFMEQQEKKP